MHIFELSSNEQGNKPNPRYFATFGAAWEQLVKLSDELEKERYTLRDKPTREVAEESIKLTARVRRMAVKEGKFNLYYGITKFKLEE